MCDMSLSVRLPLPLCRSVPSVPCGDRRVVSRLQRPPLRPARRRCSVCRASRCRRHLSSPPNRRPAATCRPRPRPTPAPRSSPSASTPPMERQVRQYGVVHSSAFCHFFARWRLELDVGSYINLAHIRKKTGRELTTHTFGC